MSEFFLELFSEEIPSRLQINARNELTQIFNKFFDDNEIIVKGKINTYSTPNRLIVHINKISKDVIKKDSDKLKILSVNNKLLYQTDGENCGYHNFIEIKKSKKSINLLVP